MHGRGRRSGLASSLNILEEGAEREDSNQLILLSLRSSKRLKTLSGSFFTPKVFRKQLKLLLTFPGILMILIIHFCCNILSQTVYILCLFTCKSHGFTLMYRLYLIMQTPCVLFCVFCLTVCVNRSWRSGYFHGTMFRTQFIAHVYFNFMHYCTGRIWYSSELCEMFLLCKFASNCLDYVLLNVLLRCNMPDRFWTGTKSSRLNVCSSFIYKYYANIA